MKKLMLSTAIVGAALFATTATAATFEYSAPDLNGIYDSSYSFNDATNQFSLDFEVDAPSSIDGFWIVVSEGPQPYHLNSGEYAILYSDLNDVWAYQYETSVAGVGGVNVAFDGTLLAQYSSAVTTTVGATRTTYSMSLDLDSLNSRTDLGADWKGVSYGRKIGTWLHGTENTFAHCPKDAAGAPIYTDASGLSCFRANNWTGWDESNRDTNVVPLPAAGWMLLAGLGGLAAASRRRKSS